MPNLDERLDERLIIHVGAPKTGTTGLQSALYSMHEALAERSVSYPNVTGLGFGWQAERGITCGNGEIALGYDRAVNEAAWHNLLKKCAEVPTQPVQILSSEMLVGIADKEFFWQHLANHADAVGKQAVVVVYLRDPFPFFLSAYAQEIKATWFRGTLEQWVDGFFNYIGSVPYRNLDLMQDFARRYGCELKTYRYEDISANIVEHFLATACGVSIEGLTIPERRMNSSLTPYDCSFHRGVNSMNPALGRLLSLDRMDCRVHVPYSGEPGRFELSHAGEARLEESFGRYRSLLTEFTDFADRVDYSIDRRDVVESYTAEEAGVHLKFFELGQFIGASHVTGYIAWDFDKRLNEK